MKDAQGQLTDQNTFPDAAHPGDALNRMEDIVVSLRCYEPNSRRIDLTGEDLCRNSLLVGTVGSGKTTCLNAFVRDMISYRSSEIDSRVGLLIIDSKMDETGDKVQSWAKAAGREGDLWLLTPTSNFCYDFLAALKSFAELDEVVDKICSAFPFNDPNNPYWVQGRRPLLDAALTIMLVTSKSLDFSEVMRFLHGWLMNPGITEVIVRDRINLFRQLAQRSEGELDRFAQNKIQSTLSTVAMWTDLDGKTKSNWTSVFANCLSPFMTVSAQAYFDARDRVRIDIEQIVTEGKIAVVSVNAAKDPDLARLLGRLVKADFYRAAQSRRIAYADTGRLVGLIMDEYPLVVTGAEGRFGDIVQLQSLRAKRAFVVAATQGFVSLDMVIGAKAREALLVNFNNLFFLNSHEAEIDHFAKAHFGVAESSFKGSLQIEEADADGQIATLNQRTFHARCDDWVCPPGRLSHLQCNQAFVSLAGGRRYNEPVWIEPLYHEGTNVAADDSAPTTSMDVLRRIASEFVEEDKRKKQEISACESVSNPTDSDNAGAEKVHKSEPQDPGSLRLQLTQPEFAVLWRPTGIISRYVRRHPEDQNLLSIANEAPPTAEIIVTLPQSCLAQLLLERAFNRVERHFQKSIRSFLHIRRE